MILGIAQNAGCFWVDDVTKTDVRAYAVIKHHCKTSVAMYPDFVITAIWIDESGYAVFVDFDGDGIEDIAHVHQVYFYMEDGSPVYICQGNHNPEDFREQIKEWIFMHSVKGDTCLERFYAV